MVAWEASLPSSPPPFPLHPASLAPLASSLLNSPLYLIPPLHITASSASHSDVFQSSPSPPIPFVSLPLSPIESHCYCCPSSQATAAKAIDIRRTHYSNMLYLLQRPINLCVIQPASVVCHVTSPFPTLYFHLELCSRGPCRSTSVTVATHILQAVAPTRMLRV